MNEMKLDRAPKGEDAYSNTLSIIIKYQLRNLKYPFTTPPYSSSKYHRLMALHWLKLLERSRWRINRIKVHPDFTLHSVSLTSLARPSFHGEQIFFRKRKPVFFCFVLFLHAHKKITISLTQCVWGYLWSRTAYLERRSTVSRLM